MTPLALQSGAAHDLLAAVITTWIAIEVLLRLSSAGRRLAWDWTFPLVVAAITAGVSLGFQAAHFKTGNIGGGWGPVAIGLIGAVFGIALRVWAIITLGPLFKVRIRVEETRLVPALGHDYSDYAARTRRLIPGLW